jgi:hypothetical protein
MSYEFIKLSEVEVIETSKTANLLIEEDGEIKRLPASNFDTTPNVQADWNETDDSSPAYIANKPESLGGGGEIIKFIMDSGTAKVNDVVWTTQDFKDAWDRGATLIYTRNGSSFVDEGKIVSAYFSLSSGTVSYGSLSYIYSSGIGYVNV